MLRWRRLIVYIAALLAALLAGGSLAAQTGDGDYFVYFGTYTGFKYMKKGAPTGRSLSKGIYVSRFHPATGEVSEARLAAEMINPSFLAVHPNHKFLYAVSEDPLSLGPALDKASYVSAFAIDPAQGNLRLLNTVPTGGTSTCYLSVDQTGKFVLLANYGDGSVAVRRLKADGSLGEQTALLRFTGHGVDPSYQLGPHAHSIDVSPDNRFAVVSDLGTDKLRLFRFDADSGHLAPNDPPDLDVRPAAGGPRHFTFAPDGKHGYLVSEMSGIVTVYEWDAARGLPKEVQAVHTMPADFNLYQNANLVNPYRSAEVSVHPNGKYLYESNRGPDTIGVYAVNAADGKLSRIQDVSSRGLTPRQFAIDPTGKYLLAANQITDSVTIFRIEDGSGRILATRSALRVETPVCVRFVPAN
jgi:6-phosphogluconolactonase